MATMKNRLAKRLKSFFKAETTGGLIMILTAISALIIANSFSAEWYQHFIKTPISFSFGEASASTSLKHFVKDVLMVFFFLIVGMELKSEMLEGFLTDKKQILLPLLAAIGGMIAPAGVFLFFNHGLPEYVHGWAIPSATDIAFALCILMLVGKNLPPSLKVFLLAIAIFDDLGAILVIAFFYTETFAITPFIMAISCSAFLFLLNKLKVMTISAYLAVGVLLCYYLHHSGIHTTVGGVIVGMAIPLRDPNKTSYSPLNTLMHFLHPWVSFLILPIFAFTAAGVSLQGVSFSSILNPLVLGVSLGLFIGKQIGILGVSLFCVKLGLAELPEDTNWRQIYGVSVLAGIGFTMSLFIGLLAFSDPLLQEQVKLGVIVGSTLATAIGWLVLRGANTSS
jgi:Na+:H+ antiporter, NhaA family